MTKTKISLIRLASSACALGLSLMAVTPMNAVSAAGGYARNEPAVLLSVGESRVVNLAGKASDVVIANPNVADVYVRSSNQIYIQGKAAGESTLFVTSKDGKILYSATVRVGNNLSSVDQMLRLAMPDANIIVSNMNGMTLLTGTIKAPEDAAEAERLVQAFVGKDVTVVSRLRTATPLQVNLQVKISEVSRNLLHQVGTNFTTWDSSGGKVLGFVGSSSRDFVSRSGNSFTFTAPTNTTSIGGVAKLFGMDVAGALDLAEQAGLATTLAQPNLTSLSGETASFLAGGEYPYSVSNGLQGNTIEFKQYGVQLAFTPTVLADGRVSMRVRPSVSSLDFSVSSSIPALKTRTAETTVELGSGQSFMIAGLLSNDTSNNINKVPGLGNVPVLGSLFKSRKFLRNETELVIVVTPYLVKPVNARDIALPTDGFRNATNLQGLIMQQSSDGKSGQTRPLPSVESGTNAPAADYSPVMPGPAAMETRTSKKTRKKQTADTSAAIPGFSF
jgi:pilus assembly protein CpaC